MVGDWGVLEELTGLPHRKHTRFLNAVRSQLRRLEPKIKGNWEGGSAFILRQCDGFSDDESCQTVQLIMACSRTH